VFIKPAPRKAWPTFFRMMVLRGYKIPLADSHDK
jgi:hypothetical protein